MFIHTKNTETKKKLFKCPLKSIVDLPDPSGRGKKKRLKENISMFRVSVNSGEFRVLCKPREANGKKWKDLILIILAKPLT